MFKSPTFDEEVFKRHPHFGQFVKYLASLDEESARGATIIAIAVLDELLKDMIAGFLIEGEGSSELLEGRYAPLSTFCSEVRRRSCSRPYLRREYKELGTLRKIRNEFAHKLDIDFKNQRVQSLAANLTYAFHEVEGRPVTANSKFTTSATAIIVNLVNYVRHVPGKRLSHIDWGALT